MESFCSNAFIHRFNKFNDHASAHPGMLLPVSLKNLIPLLSFLVFVSPESSPCHSLVKTFMCHFVSQNPRLIDIVWEITVASHLKYGSQQPPVLASFMLCWAKHLIFVSSYHKRSYSLIQEPQLFNAHLEKHLGLLLKEPFNVIKDTICVSLYGIIGDVVRHECVVSADMVKLYLLNISKRFINWISMQFDSYLVVETDMLYNLCRDSYQIVMLCQSWKQGNGE